MDDDGNLQELTTPFDEPDTLVELGMSSFVYTNRQGAGEHPDGTFDPETGLEHYRLLDGQWRRLNRPLSEKEIHQLGNSLMSTLPSEWDDLIIK